MLDFNPDRNERPSVIAIVGEEDPGEIIQGGYSPYMRRTNLDFRSYRDSDSPP